MVIANSFVARCHIYADENHSISDTDHYLLVDGGGIFKQKMKILLGIDAAVFEKSALDFACFIARLTESRVTGIFLDNSASKKPKVLKSGHTREKIDGKFTLQTEVSAIRQTITHFTDGCINRGALYKIHSATGVPADELIYETRFADLLVLDAEMSFKKAFEGMPTNFAKTMLAKAECPVLIAPDRFDRVDEILFTYDGLASSVFAIKQFTYLFPEFRGKRITILHVSDKTSQRDAQASRLIEWLKLYFFDAHIEIHSGNLQSTLLDFCLKRQNLIVVMGAFGRSSVSRFFKESAAELLIETIAHPIFISHR